MSIDTKSLRQQKQAEMWRVSKGLGGFKNPTGFGKTYQTLNYICKPMLAKNRTTYFIVVVHTVSLKNQWEARIKQFLPGQEDRFLVETVQAIYTRGVKLQCTCLIIDELDEFFSPERRKVWDNAYIEFTFLCWLSATPEDRRRRHLEFLEKYPMLDEVTIQEALDNGWIAKYREFNLGVELTPEEKQGYDDLSLMLYENIGKFDYNLDMVHKVLSKETEHSDGTMYTGFQWACGVAYKNGWRPKFEDWRKNGFPANISKVDQASIIDILSQWSPGLVIGYAKRSMQYTRERVQIIYNSKAKREAAIKVCQRFTDRKTILFSQSVEFAEAVARDLNDLGLPTLAYHSKIESRPLRKNHLGQPDLYGNGDYIRNKGGKAKGEPKPFSAKKIRELIIETVESGKCTRLSSAAALDKGVDIPDIELGILTSMTRNAAQYVQRRGRTTRVNPNGDPSFVYIVNIYAKGTKEEQNLKELQKDKQFVFWIDSIDAIGDGIVETTDSFTLDDL